MLDHVADTESFPDLYVGDDAKLICDLLSREWPDTPGQPRPTFVYEREAYMMDSRFGTIFVYLVSSQKTISDTDYRTVDRSPRLGIKLSCRSRDLMFAWSRIIESILLAHRRSMRRISPYTFLELTSERPDNNADGWYSYNFDIKLTGYHIPIHGSGYKPPGCSQSYDDYQGGL